MFEAISIEKYLELLDRYSEYKNCYFRGQLEKYTSTPPGISRKESYFNNEHHIYNDAINIAKNDFEGLNAPVEKLSKMQHYGIPTRLVDITVDPLIALYFAVENTSDLSHANVYVYIQEDFEINDKEVKAVSLLATKKYIKITELCEDFNNNYGEELTANEMKKLIEQPVFLRHTEELRKSNPRLFNQKGAFVICTNVLCEDSILDEIKSIDSVPSIMTIRIPYEHKSRIKSILDKSYNINETTIYPELTSVARYLRNKYIYKSCSYENSYEIIESDYSNTYFANRLSIKAILTSKFTIEEIESIATKIISENKENNKVVWLFIYLNKEDYIVNNYIIRTQWIHPDLPDKYKPLLPKNRINENHYFDYGKQYSTLADYYKEHVFMEDKELFIGYKLNFDKAVIIFDEIFLTYKNSDVESVIPTILKEKDNIRQCYIISGEFGASKNIELEETFKRCDVFFAEFDNLPILCEDKKANQNAINYQIRLSINNLTNMIEKIRKNNDHWANELKLCKDDYDKYNPYSTKTKPFNYIQTIPVKNDAINVYIKEKVILNPDKTLFIEGITNIFDGASLMLTIQDTDDKMLAQSKTNVVNGKFSFSTMSQNSKGFKCGEYNGRISLSIPTTQSKEFTKQAGIEYENFTGDLVDRTGYGPTLDYKFSFEI